jgi:hypothetical protein
MPKSQADYDRRAEHLELLKRAIDDESINAYAHEAFERMYDEMTNELPSRCAWGPAVWKKWDLSSGEEKWVLKMLGEEVPEPDTRLTGGEIPRGREVATPAVLQNLPKAPPGRKQTNGT